MHMNVRAHTHTHSHTMNLMACVSLSPIILHVADSITNKPESIAWSLPPENVWCTLIGIFHSHYRNLQILTQFYLGCASVSVS